MRPRGDFAQVAARVPAVAESWSYIDEAVLRSGVVDARLKELCYRRLAGEADVPAPGERERTALEWTEAIAIDAERADDALWSRLHRLFSEAELVDLGCAIGFELGRQHWRRTLGLPARG